jgi:hypothetical protein
VDLRGCRALLGGTEIRGNLSDSVVGAALCFLCDEAGE